MVGDNCPCHRILLRRNRATNVFNDSHTH
jgi:hypothetical protein